jgi:dihydrolipoamide dehydrogenase
MDSTSALALEEVPKRLLVLGGGVIGLEMASIYASLGSEVSVVELTGGLLPGCDRDLVRPLEKRLGARLKAIMTDTRVKTVEALKEGFKVVFEGAKAPSPQIYDRILSAAGRRPNGDGLHAEKAGVNVDAQGFIKVDSAQRTNVVHIFAIGDVAGNPMLAHKASYEAKIAAEVASGMNVTNSAKVIPSVVYTDPEVAWVGLNETAAKRDGIPFEKATFPWMASGRSLTMGRDEGITKILVDPVTRALLGVGIVGPHAGDLIAEATLAIETGCEPGDVGLTIHPHPSLSETFAFAAEAYEGTLTELYIDRK